jgi:hypothetical protein
MGDGVMPAPTAKNRYTSDLVPDEPGGCSGLARLVGSRLADWAAVEGEADTS